MRGTYMEYRTMFSPVKIGTVQIRTALRLRRWEIISLIQTVRSARSKAYYAARAKGGFGLVTIESTVVYSEAKGGRESRVSFLTIR